MSLWSAHVALHPDLMLVRLECLQADFHAILRHQRENRSPHSIRTIALRSKISSRPSVATWA